MFRSFLIFQFSVVCLMIFPAVSQKQKMSVGNAAHSEGKSGPSA